MATQVQLRRGTTAQNAAFTGVEGEVTFDTQTHRLLTHDGITVGGFKTAMLETLNIFTVQQVVGAGNQIILQANGAATFSPAGGGQVSIDPTLTETISFEGAGIDVGGGEAVLIGGNLTFNNTGGGSIISIDSDGPTTVWSISGTGAASFGAGNFTIAATGLLGFADGVRQTFNPDGTNSGFNVGSNAADPSAPVNGDIWYQSTANELRARINGVTVSLGSGGSSPPFTDSTALVAGSVDPTKLLRFEVDGFTAATTRVLTPQDADYTIAGLETLNVFTANQTVGAGSEIQLNIDGSASFGGGNTTISNTGDVVIINTLTMGSAAIIQDLGGVLDIEGLVSITTPGVNLTPLVFTGYSLTGANAQTGVDFSGTWNTSGAPTVWKTNMTNTASGALSLFVDYQLDSVSRFRVGKFGVTTITYPGIGVTPTDGLQLQNTAAAAAGAQQASPAIRLTGQGWKTTAVAASQPLDWRIYNLPSEGGSAPSTELRFEYSINSGAFSAAMRLSPNGLILAAGLTINSGNISIPAASIFIWVGRGRLASSADGIIELFNAAQTGFTRLNFGGTSSSFPSIARVGATLSFVLADGTGNAAFTSGSHTMATAALLSISSGTNQRAGNAVLVAGTVTVGNTTVTANTIVMLTRKTSGGTIGTAITYTLSAGTSFTINSDSALDTSTFSYLLIEVP